MMFKRAGIRYGRTPEAVTPYQRALGGLSIALDAYRASLHGAPAPVVAGLTSDQRVFLRWAQVWAGKTQPEAIRKQEGERPAQLRKFRVNGVVRNVDGWYDAFGVKPGDALYVPPESALGSGSPNRFPPVEDRRRMSRPGKRSDWL